jgi:hypothetical protein
VVVQKKKLGAAAISMSGPSERNGEADSSPNMDRSIVDCHSV